MTVQEILDELESMGSKSAKKMLMKNHGVQEPCFGVKVGDMKTIQKRIKKDYQLALDLYDTGNYDAMYLAGLIADDARMTKKDLRRWAGKAYAGALPGYTVAGVAAGSRYGHELALEWIESPQSLVAAAGWATLCGLVSIKDDTELDLPELKRLIKRVQKEIHIAPGTARYWMNMFVISVGCYVEPLMEFSIQAGENIGMVTADLGDNQCKIPFIPHHILKVQKRGTIGKKRKTAKC